jgi:hypothetical protein
MSSRVGKGKVVRDPSGKATFVRKKGYATKRQHLKADRQAKAWGKKSK